MRRTPRLRLLALLLAAAAAAACAPSAEERAHDAKLRGLARWFDSVPHPAGTARVGRVKEVGLLDGNGNHCDYLVGELRTYPGTPEEVARAYGIAPLPKAVRGGGVERLRLAFVDGAGFADETRRLLPARYVRVTDWGASPDPTKRHYVVFAFDPSYDAGSDPRCH